MTKCNLCGMSYDAVILHSTGECAQHAGHKLKLARVAVDGSLDKISSMAKRIAELEGVIQKLRACYNWDRGEYQDNPTLVLAVEEAIKLVRGEARESKKKIPPPKPGRDST